MADVLSSGRDPDERPRREPSRLQVVLAVAAVAVLVVGALRLLLTSTEKEPVPPPSLPPNTLPHLTRVPDGPDATPDPAEPPGVVVKNAFIGNAFEYVDARAAAGPWTITIRGSGGSLGVHSAVLTFPAPRATFARKIRVGKAQGSAAPGEIVWRVPGGYARVRGDLPDADLLRIAEGTTIESGRPLIRTPAGLAAPTEGPYRSRVVRDARYNTADLGEQAHLGAGIVVLSGASCGGLEDRLLEKNARPAGRVHGRPAVVAEAIGGSGLLAWETAPGVIAMVGYSGGPLDDDAVAALRRIAERTRLLDVRQWQATNPATTEQTNDFS